MGPLCYTLAPVHTYTVASYIYTVTSASAHIYSGQLHIHSDMCTPSYIYTVTCVLLAV